MLHQFFLATVISIVLYYSSRIALTIYLSRTGLDKIPGVTLTGFFPNLLVVLLLVGYFGMIINGTLLAATFISQFF